MKLFAIKSILRAVFPVVFASVLSYAAPVGSDTLLASFTAPESSSGCHVLWHWMNGHMNKDAITKDLQAMNRSGYTGALIFNVGVGIPIGKVEYGSAEWFELLEHTFDEAEKYDIEISLHNSPGYSGAGGPWITPEKSMQQLVWTESRLEVGLNGTSSNSSITLKEPLRKLGYYQDIAALAYPSLPEENGAVFRNAIQTIKINDTEVPLDVTQGIRLDAMLRVESAGATIDITMKYLFTASAISIFRFPEIPLDTFDGARDYPAIWTLTASNDSTTWKTVTSISSPALRKFDAPAVGTFLLVVACYFRLKPNRASWISGIEIHSGPRLDNWALKAHASAGSVADPARIVTTTTSVINPDEVVDITEFMNEDGTLNWKVPPGRWTIVRFGHTATGQEMPAAPESGEGLSVDLFSTEALDFHIEKHIKPIVAAAKDHVGRSFRGLEIDSYELGLQTWSTNFREEFKKYRGYDMGSWLLATTGRILISALETEKFLFDLRTTHADLVAKNHYAHFRKALNDMGVLLLAEPYGDGPFDSMEVAAEADLAFGEFWARYTYGSDGYPQIGTSMSHQEGYTLNPAEAFTGQPMTARWTEHPYSLKAEGDRMFTLGVNRLMLHSYAMQPEDHAMPGMTMGPFGAHFDRRITWTDQATGWTTYLKRAQGLLQQGKPVVDVACFGREEPNPKVTQTYLAPCSIPLGYGADILSKSKLLEMTASNVRAGLPSGVSYKLIVFPPMNAASKEVLEKISELANAGVGILLSGSPPSRGLGRSIATGAGTDESVIAAGTKLWNKTGNGNVFNGTATNTTLISLGIEPDFTFTSDTNDAAIYSIHRVVGDSDVYFVSNGLRKTVQSVLSLRTIAGIPELWYAETGRRISAPYERKNNRTFIPLTFNPAESVFVIFRQANPSSSLVQVSHNGVSLLQTAPFPSPNPALYRNISVGFSITFWAKPEPIEEEVPGFGLGTNGFLLSESSANTPATVLEVAMPISGWTHFAIVYTANLPVVYINGKVAGAGKKSSSIVHPGVGTPDSTSQMVNRFEGDQISLKVHPSSLTAADISALFENDLPEPIAPPAIEILNQKNSLLFRENGEFKFNLSNGRTKSLNITSVSSTTISGPWTVSLPEGSGVNSNITLDKLQSLHKHDDFDIAHFSGTATWTTSFNFSNHSRTSSKILLNLGRVDNIAQVFVNGKDAGLLWKPPYEIDITSCVKSGPAINLLAVEVTNLWPNRLIGDESLPVEAAFNSTNENLAVLEFPDWYLNNQPKTGERVTFTSWRHFESDGPLYESGLLGPVNIIFAATRSL
ncbi:hypothetical protein DFP73DRAFT_602938 [Morchella snyderi]|nr:hypothetical protein DFP73DRAFT_602938 [Morchella snyderi]